MSKPNYGETVRLTVAQALVQYISAQYSVSDGVRQRFVPGALGIFGHGNLAGLGQALDQYSDQLPFIQGRNEQGIAHIATAFAKANLRTRTLAVTASIGPGALNMVTAAGLATINRLPLLLLPGDAYATRRQGPVLQQLEDPTAPDISVNDAFRPVSKFFDRITRPEQLLTSLPNAFRVLANPVETGAVVIALPQDIQSHAFDFPVSFFAEKDWKIRRILPDPVDLEQIAALISKAQKPIIIAGGGVLYSQASSELEQLAESTGIPVCETFGGKGAVTKKADWQLGGIGLEGTPATNKLVNQADLVLHVGTRLTDFATASQSIFQNPDVEFVSINVSEFDGVKQGALTAVGDAKLALTQLNKTLKGFKVPASWASEVAKLNSAWRVERALAMDPDVLFDKKTLPNSPITEAILTQGQLLGVLQEHAQDGDILIAAAGGPPGDVQKIWDATDGRHAHLEFGFSCMGYEIPAAIGVRLANPNTSNRVITFVGDGTFVMAPTELVTAAQEGLDLTVVISENHGYQVIRRLQMGRVGKSFGNEFRYRTAGPLFTDSAKVKGEVAKLEGDYLAIDLVKMAEGMGCKTYRPVSADEFRKVLKETRSATGPIVIVVPTVQHALLPGAGVWWDVAPAEVSTQAWIAPLRQEYEEGLKTQRWHG
jgi:3D-(3,5/4)-trihydroxycyclohexane-1,2-dione acylhydrolase (decyclizing)